MSNERQEKPERKPPEHDEKWGGEEKWRRDPISSVFFALILLVLGVLLFLAVRDVILWQDWWKYFLIGIGSVFIIEVIVRAARPAYRRPVLGRLIPGVILICIGLAFLGGLSEWWPLIVVALAVAILLRVLLRRT